MKKQKEKGEISAEEEKAKNEKINKAEDKVKKMKETVAKNKKKIEETPLEEPEME